MSSPTGDLSQVLSNLKDDLDQLGGLLDDLGRNPTGLHPEPEPVDDPRLSKPIKEYDLGAIVAALNRATDPFTRSALGIQGVELTQSVQFYDLYGQGSGAAGDNFVPLVAGKDLILRAYVEHTPSFFTAPGRFDGVVTYRGKELKSLNGPQALQEPTALRRSLTNHSLNFRIPAADCHGTVNFTVRVHEWRRSDAPTPPGSSSYYRNRATYKIAADFRDVPRMKITGVLFRFTGNGLDLPAPSGVDLVNTMARFLPMFPIRGYDYNVCTVDDFDKDLTLHKNWAELLTRISKLRSASTVRTFYVGLLPAGVSVLPGAPVRGIGNTGVALSSNDDTRALSHELGHGCNRPHVAYNNAPEPWDAKFPFYGSFPYGSIGEEGIDTAQMTLYDPKDSFDFMTYNENGAPVLFTTSTWISPYNYWKMMDYITKTGGTGDDPTAATSTAASLLFNFRIHRGGRVEVLPSYPVTNVPNNGDGRQTVDVMLDVFDRDAELIRSVRCHQHNPYQDADGAYVDFLEVLPWSEQVGEIAVVSARQELCRVQAGASGPSAQPPEIRLLDDDDRGTLARLDWSVPKRKSRESDPAQTAALVRYSHDGGHTWQAIAADVRATHCLVNLDLLAGGDECRFQVIVSSGLAATVVDSEQFVVRRKPRRAYIISPQNGQTFRQGQPITFAGGGHSPDFGASTDDEVSWSSSRECCELGSGTYLVRDDLLPGTHRVTLSTGDGADGEASASIRITVLEASADDHW